MRLINADELKVYHGINVGANYGGLREIVFKRDIDNAPTIDAVGVVRCKDCRHYKQSATADRKMCFRKDIDGFSVCYEFEPNDWCSYAERGEE